MPRSVQWFMKVLFRIPIFGDNYQLATLSKYDDVPTGIYSDRPLNSSIALTRDIKAHVRLRVEDMALDDGIALLVSDNRVKVTELLSTLGIENFESFLLEAERLGWKTEKYLDAISGYFLVDDRLLPLSLPSLFSHRLALLAILSLLIAAPSLFFVFYTSG